MKTFFILAILFLNDDVKADFLETEKLQVAAGIQYRSLLYKRGIITYEGFQATPIYSVNYENSSFLLAGSSLFYKRGFNRNWSFRTRLNIDSTEDNPLYITEEKEEERVRRDETSEWDSYFEYLTERGHYFRFQFSQDLQAHNGSYIELRGRIALADYLKKGQAQPLIQPAVFAALGAGSKEHNEYFYGSDSAGLNNIEYGFLITSPKVIDVFWPTLKITRFEILGEDNRAGNLVQEKDGFSFEALMAFRVW
ncbi:MAG: hypothetical protein CME65_14675 [Halobacteriovoraceae bacterium]|nr:hypothetical protein [Halobacteriovoraceae bacterium]